MDSIAHRTRSRKRNYSEMIDNDEVGPNFDILECFPILLCQYVFQHFDAKELLEMSKVNREWSKLVAERSQAKKLEISLVSSKGMMTRKVKRVLMKSTRKYSNITIAPCPNDGEFVLAFMAKRKGSWKKVLMLPSAQTAQDIWPKILPIVEPTVEELTIIGVYNSNDESLADTSSWTFPRLKTLKCFAAGHNHFKYFGRVTSLVNFAFSRMEEEILDVKTILRNNSNNLKRIFVMTRDATFFEHLTEINLKLQKLYTVQLHRGDSTQRFLSFLKTQAQTLESLRTYVLLEQPHLELILGMPRLTSLAVNSISEEIQELPVNKIITSLEFLGKERAAILIRALQSLKRFKCCEIDGELLLLLQDVPALESIETKFFNVPRIPESAVFANIKDFKADKFHGDFVEPTGDSNFEKLVKRAMMLSAGGGAE